MGLGTLAFQRIGVADTAIQTSCGITRALRHGTGSDRQTTVRSPSGITATLGGIPVVKAIDASDSAVPAQRQGTFLLVAALFGNVQTVP
jgi:hypothetical protein